MPKVAGIMHATRNAHASTCEDLISVMMGIGNEVRVHVKRKFMGAKTTSRHQNLAAPPKPFEQVIFLHRRVVCRCRVSLSSRHSVA